MAKAKKAVKAWDVTTGAPDRESRGGRPIYKVVGPDGFIGNLYGREGTKSFTVTENR